MGSKRFAGLVVITIVAVILWSPLEAQDARAVLDAASKAMGTGNLQAVEYSAASGNTYAVGQAPGPGKPWPRFTITRYNALINYSVPIMREQTVRIDDENPPRGGGAGPYVPETQQGGIRPIPFGPQTANAVRDGRTANGALQIWLTPHGFLKGAAANNATVRAGTQRGRRDVSFRAFDRYTITGTINDENLVERVQTTIANPLYGDMLLEAIYSDYRDVAGVKFPMRIVQRQGGFPSLELRLANVQPNSAAALATTAPALPTGPPPTGTPPRAPAKDIAPGFWALEGSIPMNFLVEFRDFVVVIEAVGNAQRSELVLSEVRQLIPSKPIRYVINTHQHSDHSGGLREVVAQGLPILTHQVNKAFYEKMLRNPATIEPDKLANNPRAPMIEGVTDKKVITDGTKTIEVHHVRGNLHDEGLLMVYFPKERLLLQADAYAPRPPGAKPLPPSPYTTNLYENIQRLKLTVDQMVHVHGGMDPIAKLAEQANRRGTN
jgi:glyoxylase-like metal-dependent hydrolase (beta-lactamase superfamily II)